MARKHTYATKTDLEKLVARMQKTGIICSEAMREVKKQFIVSALQMADGNRTRAAYLLGMYVNTLARNIQTLGIDIHSHRSTPLMPNPWPYVTNTKSPVD